MGGGVSGRGGKKREKFDGIWKCVSLCVTGRSESFPWPRYSSPDAATNCSDVLTATKWLTHMDNRIVKVQEQALGAVRAIYKGPSEEGSTARSSLPVLSLAPTSPLKGSAYGFCQRCTSIFHPINNYHYQPNWRL